jgi:putative membrane protein
MKTLHIGTLAAILATATATTPCLYAQTPPTSPDPSGASSPHQRDVTGSTSAESPATSGSAPGDASSPHQREALQGSTSGRSDAQVGRQHDPAQFVKMAAQDSMTEVELGKVAMNKSNNAAIKRFAQKMVQDHGAANAELSGIASGKSLEVPARLDAEHQGIVQKMAAKSGAAFDSDYARHMAMDDTQAIALFQSETKSSDPELAAFAKKTLPTLQEHKRMADSLSAGMADSTARAQ